MAVQQSSGHPVIQASSRAGDSAGGAAGVKSPVTQLLERMFHRPNPDDDPYLSDKSLSAYLASSTFSSQFTDKFDTLHLSPRQRGLIHVGASALYEYLIQPAFDKALMDEVLPQAAGLLALALPEDGWLHRKQHSLHRLLKDMATVMYGWYPDHPQAKEIKQQVRLWLEQLSQRESPDEVLEKVTRWRESFEARCTRLRERVVQAEQGAMRLAYARTQSTKAVNQMLAGRPLPDFLADSLSRVWQPGLQWIALNDDVGSPLWRQAVRTLGLVIWSAQPEVADDKHREKLTRIVSEQSDELSDLLGKILADSQAAEQEKELIETMQAWQLMKKPLEYVEVPALETDDVPQHEGELSATLLADIDNLAFDDWFVVAKTGQRVQLLLKQDAYRQLLFVNQLGMKTLVCSFEEFAWQFAEGELQRLPELIPLDTIVLEHLNDLNDSYKRKVKARKEAEQKKRREAAWLAQLSREKAEHEARELAAQKAREEEAREREANKALYAEQARREQALQRWGQDVTERRRKIRLLLSGLPLETRFRFYTQTGEMTRRKLAMVMPSSGKYIFEDSMGNDKLDMSRNDLVDALVAGAVEVELDKQFADMLDRRNA